MISQNLHSLNTYRICRVSRYIICNIHNLKKDSLAQLICQIIYHKLDFYNNEYIDELYDRKIELKQIDRSISVFVWQVGI